MFRKSIVNMTLLFSIVLLSLNLVFNACKETISDSEQSQNVRVPLLQGVLFESGRLKFETLADFDKCIEVMMANKRYLPNFAAQFPGFKSSRAAYKQLIRAEGERLNPANLPELVTAVKKEDGEIYLRPTVDLGIRSYIANEKGIYQIGNTVYKFTYHKVYEVPEELVNLLDSPNLDAVQGVKSEIIHRSSTPLFSGGADDRAWAFCDRHYWGSPYKRKFYGEIQCNYGLGWEEVRVDYDHYSRGIFGSWSHNDAPSMSFTGTVTVSGSSSCGSIGGLFPTSMSGSDESEIFDVLYSSGFCTSTGCAVTLPSTVTFSGNGDNGFSFFPACTL